MFQGVTADILQMALNIWDTSMCLQMVKGAYNGKTLMKSHCLMLTNSMEETFAVWQIQQLSLRYHLYSPGASHRAVLNYVTCHFAVSECLIYSLMIILKIHFVYATISKISNK